MAARIVGLPAGLLLVVRANPASSGATSAELSADFDAALVRALRPDSARGDVQAQPGRRVVPGDERAGKTGVGRAGGGPA